MANVVRVWIDRKFNVSPDVGSLLRWETAVAKHLPVPHGPLLDFIRKLFTSPEEAARDVSVRYRESGVESWVEQSHAAPHGYATSGSGLDGFFSSAPAGNETTDTSGEPSSSASVPRSESSVPVSGPE